MSDPARTRSQLIPAYRELIAGRILRTMKDEEGPEVQRSAAEIMAEAILEGMQGELVLRSDEKGVTYANPLHAVKLYQDHMLKAKELALQRHRRAEADGCTVSTSKRRQFVSTTIGTGSGPPPGISSSSFAVVEVTRRSEMAAGPGGGMDPANSLEFLARYGLVILPALVVAEQFGIPLRAVPALLGVGALAATGQVSIPLVLGAVVTVALSVDFAWYELGRRRGPDVLAKLCRMSPEPDACVSKAKNVFAHYGAGAMLVAKFVPGLTTVMPPLAGVVAMGRGRFALYELGGVLLWAGTWLGLGYFFSDAISSIALSATRLGRVLGVIVVAAAGAYVLVKYLRRRLPCDRFAWRAFHVRG